MPPVGLAAFLDATARRAPERAILTLHPDKGEPRPVRAAELDARARAFAAGYRKAGLRPGDRVALPLPTGLDFVAALFGCFYAGCVAVPLYPPMRRADLAGYRARTAEALAITGCRAVVTEGALTGLFEAIAASSGTRARVADAAAWRAEPGAGEPPAGPEGPSALAVMQFSSGSTGRPKPVALTHAQVEANVRAIGAALAVDPERDVACSWLPLYHDMGLFGGLITPIAFGVPLHLLSPLAFMLAPTRWPALMSAHGVTLTCAPNFAYALVARRVRPAEVAGWDLSRLRVALNGAEPVLPETLETFAMRLAPAGFDARAFKPVYGLAEAVLAATFTPLAEGARSLRLAAPAEPAAAAPVVPAPGGPAAVVSAGVPLAGYRIAIRHPETGEHLPELTVGEIVLQGPSLLDAYWEAPEATAAARTPEGWLRTGDWGFLADGWLYPTARLKEVIVKGGVNYAPEPIERAAEAVPGVRPGSAVAFGSAAAEAGTEALVVLFEPREAGADPAPEVARAVADAVGLKPDVVLAVPKGAIPKTTSGKRRRLEARRRYEAGALQAPAATPLRDALAIAGGRLAYRLGHAPDPA